MFRGLTTATINQATMIDALQQYFDRRLADGVQRIEVRNIEAMTDFLGQKFLVTFIEGETMGSKS